jgi:hypothetical protein
MDLNKELSELKQLKAKVGYEGRNRLIFEIKARFIKTLMSELGITEYEISEVQRGYNTIPRCEFSIDGNSCSMSLEHDEIVLNAGNGNGAARGRRLSPNQCQPAYVARIILESLLLF